MFQFNSQNNKTYNNWYNVRNDEGKKLEKIPSITNIVDGKKRYYSSIDAELYFGDIFIDEVSNIAWTIQQQSLPIFGYNSYCFDDVAIGSRLIQGQFAINFTEKNYLETLQNNSNFQKIARRMYGDDVESKVEYSDFREKLHLPKWDKGFDIVIGFGSNKTNKNNNIYSTYLVIDCVQITGSSMQLDDNGERILELYTFIARDIKDSFINTGDSSNEQPKEKISEKHGSLSLYANLKLSSNSNQIKITSADQVEFLEGSLQFSGSYKDKTISSLITLTPETDNTILSANLSNQLISALKKECSNKTSLLGNIKYKYKKGNKTLEEDVIQKIYLKN